MTLTMTCTGFVGYVWAEPGDEGRSVRTNPEIAQRTWFLITDLSSEKMGYHNPERWGTTMMARPTISGVRAPLEYRLPAHYPARMNERTSC